MLERRFADLNLAICGEIFHFLDNSGRPMNFDRCRALVGEPQVDAQIAGRCIANTAGNRSYLGSLARPADHASAYCRPIAAGSSQLQPEPVANWAPIHPEFHWFVDRGDCCIHASIVIKIGKCHGAVQTRDGVSSCARGDIRPAAALIAEYPVRLRFIGVKPSAGHE